MSLRIGFAALVAATGMALALPAAAADLGPGAYPPGAAYDDPRYADMYGQPPPPPRYAAPYDAPYDRPAYRPPYRDDRGYLREMDPSPYASGYGRQGWEGPNYGASCVPREAVRDALERQGWWDFQDVALQNGVVIIRARRANGRWFDLTVERCSGRLLEARLVTRRAAEADAGPYPYRPYAPPRY